MTSEKFEAGKEVLRRAIAHDWDAGLFKQFDSRLCVSFDAVTFHMRSDAHSERCAYLFVWNQLTRYDELRAALLAALHPAMVCECHDLRTGASRVVRMTSEGRHAVLRRLTEVTVRSR